MDSRAAPSRRVLRPRRAGGFAVCVGFAIGAHAFAVDATGFDVTRVAEEGSTSILQATCPNGLTVIADQRPGTRTVFSRIAVEVGSRDEAPRHAGISHLLEHLLFEEGHGAASPAPGQGNPALSGLRAVGALVNASTDFEITRYDADLPASDFAEGWRALVQLVASADFDEKDVERERRVVLQEVALGKTDPLAIAAWSVLGEVFPGDPIGQPVIGFRRSLARIRHADLLAHYRRFYVPGNMFAVIVGDMEPREALGLACGTLGAIPAGGDVARDRPQTLAGPRDSFTFRTLTKQAYLITAALTTGAGSEEAPAFALMSTLLGEGRTSRLHRRLVEERAVTREILALAFQVSDIGAFGCGAAVDPDDAAVAGDILRQEMQRLADEPASLEEIQTARRLLEGALAMRFETNAGIADFRSERLQYGRDVARDVWRQEMEALTPMRLMRIAANAWGRSGENRAADGPQGSALPPAGIVQIRILPARGFGKVLAALRYLLFRRL